MVIKHNNIESEKNASGNVFVSQLDFKLRSLRQTLELPSSKRNFWCTPKPEKKQGLK